jgi:hypothetical protein
MFGDGYAAQRHKEAIKHIGGELRWISDPTILHKVSSIIGHSVLDFKNVIDNETKAELIAAPPSSYHFNSVDYIVIASPSYLHREQTKMALDNGRKVICEKPICLPWEPMIDDDRINVCLQLRYIPNLPRKADLVRAVMVRDKAFFDTWKGDPRLAGGNLYEFFIHYIDLAIILGADFEGSVQSEGKQERQICYYKDFPEEVKRISVFEMQSRGFIRGGRINEELIGEYRYDETKDEYIYSLPAHKGIETIDIMGVDQQSLYNLMYEDIIQGGGVKPKDIFYLIWVLNQNSTKYGFRKSGIEERIIIKKDLL